jgi:isopentenyl diphosphate isomerase/L-lactate dehydrogenase-like FMN-dependent dehydrogenase
MSLQKPINVHDYEVLARERLDKMIYDYYAGGALDEITLRENTDAWTRLRMLPRVLVDVSRIETETTVQGQSISMPVLTAPCGFNAMVHPDGEVAVARASKVAGIIQVLSTAANKSIEEVAASDGKRWFQLYCIRDREVVRSLVERAEKAGYSALCLTADVPYNGRRERDVYNNFQIPFGISFENMMISAQDKINVKDASGLNKYVTSAWDSSLTWDVVDWLLSITNLPLLIKGILTPEDARMAVEYGVTGVIVSNHGRRQLDTAINTCQALPEVVKAVDGQVEVLVDGGIRRGSDVVKALALGAKAVLIGRPYLWGLAVNGEKGVRDILEIFLNEFKMAMALSGLNNIKEIDKRIIV